MKLRTRLRIARARTEAETELGCKVPDWLADEVLAYCQRKLVCIKKDEDYLPLLYRCELPMQVQMKAITAASIGRMSQRKEAERSVRDLSSYPVRSSLPERA